MGLHKVLWEYVIDVSLVFCRTPNSCQVRISESFGCPWDSFPPIEFPCLVSERGLLSCLIVSSLVPFSCFMKVCSFLNENEVGIDPGESGGWELRGVDTGQTVVRMYYMRLESL